MKLRNKRPRLALVETDEWLKPTEQEIIDRYERFKWRLKEIKDKHGSLLKFADAYKYFGIHYDAKRKGWSYREWAPRAKAIFLIGDFNNWNRTSHPMSMKENGIWEIFLDEETYKDTFTHQSLIKILVNGENGWKERIPAYIRRVVQDEETKNFTAQVWLPKRFDWKNDSFNIGSLGELFIYECHIGMAQEKEGVGTYTEFKDNILPRIKKLGYNAIQIMAIAEHPYYGSFGYHVANFFAASSRFGTPEELKELIRTAHEMGIAVIMDIVHSHTVKNLNEGLNEFDGSDGLYFHGGARGEHPAWDSKLFDYGKTEVLQFLLSNVKFWMKEFHFDGFRFDGVTSMMYFHHGYTEFDSQEKYFKDGVEFDAIVYLQLANTLIHKINKKAVSLAEDVSGMPGLTFPCKEGGIGFDYRLGMGLPDFWIKYLKKVKDEDWNIHEMWNTLTNRLPDTKTVAYAESHDQALVGDKTIAFRLMDKEMYFHMNLESENPIIDRGIALHKMIRLFSAALGGQAYMNFMGNEFGHPEWIDFPREGNNWSYKHARRQWSIADADYLRYQHLYKFDEAMIHLMKENKVMQGGYGQQLNMDEANKTIVFVKNDLIFVFNWHMSNSIPDYEFTAHAPGEYKIILNSDRPEFGGFGRINDKLSIFTYDVEGYPKMKIYNTNRTALVLKRVEKKKKKKKKTSKKKSA